MNSSATESVVTRAAVVGGFDQALAVEEVELRPLAAGEVLVRVRATAVCITDALAIGGFTFAPPPFVTGHAAAGVVEAAGPLVTRLRVGDRVVVAGSAECGVCYFCARDQPAACTEIFGGMIPPRHVATRADGSAITADGGVGTFAERMIYREVNAVAVDAELPFEHLCLLGCGVTSGLGAVFNVADVQPGSSVAIVGAGHLGLWMLQAARAAGAADVIVVEPLTERRDAALALGATAVVDPAAGDPVEQVRELTGGRGADYGLEAAGPAEAMEQAFLMTRPAGTVVATGMQSPTATVTLPAIDYALSARTVRSSQTGGGHLQRDIPRFAAMLAAGTVDPTPIISRTFRLDEVNDALDAARARTVLTGVIVSD